MFFGWILVIIGTIFLLQHLGVINHDVWGLIWPFVFIVWGISILTGWKKGRFWNCCGGGRDKNTASIDKESA